MVQGDQQAQPGEDGGGDPQAAEDEVWRALCRFAGAMRALDEDVQALARACNNPPEQTVPRARPQGAE